MDSHQGALAILQARFNKGILHAQAGNDFDPDIIPNADGSQGGAQNPTRGVNWALVVSSCSDLLRAGGASHTSTCTRLPRTKSSGITIALKHPFPLRQTFAFNEYLIGIIEDRQKLIAPFGHGLP